MTGQACLVHSIEKDMLAVCMEISQRTAIQQLSACDREILSARLRAASDSLTHYERSKFSGFISASNCCAILSQICNVNINAGTISVLIKDKVR